MARKSSIKGITIEKNGGRLVQKRYLGVNIKRHLGIVGQEEAERWLRDEMQRIRNNKLHGESDPHTFREAGERYLEENKLNASIDTDAWHLLLLDPFIGAKQLREVHDGSLETFKDKRKADGVKPATIKRTLEVVRKILRACAETYRDEHGRLWLDHPPKISMPRKLNARQAYALSWEEQAKLFKLLPATLGRMALFKVNTGTREQEVCKLRWKYLQKMPEIDSSVFVIPPDFGGRNKGSGVKNGEPRLVVLNRIAESVVFECLAELEALEQKLIGQQPTEELLMRREYVFVQVNPRNKSCGPYSRMCTQGWRAARIAAGLVPVNVHSLKHTFGRRLRAARVAYETRQVLLGHKVGDITTLYSPAEVRELQDAVNKLVDVGPVTMLRVVA